MRAHGSKFGVKTRPQNHQKLEKVVGKIKIFLAQKSDFLCSKLDFLQRLSDFQEIQENLLHRLSDFFNGFPLSSTAFRFLQRLPNFFNGFPIFLNGFLLSKKYKKIYLRRQVYKRSLFELCISRHLLPELCNSC